MFPVAAGAQAIPESSSCQAGVDTYLRRLYGRFDLVLAPSQFVAARLHGMGVERVAVQPLGVDTTVFHPAGRDPALRSELGLPADTRLLIYAGRISAEKRVDLIRQAIELLGPPYHLVIVGGNTRCRLSAQVTMLVYEQNTVCLARLLASSDALIHAGEHETFGLVFLEAMACGRPVIGVRSGAVSEIIDDTVGRTARPGDAGSLAEAVLSLYADDLEQLGVQARDRVECRYSWESTLTKQLLRYQQLVRRRAFLDDPVPVLSG